MRSCLRHALLASLLGLLSVSALAATTAAPATAAGIEQGSYLARIGDCISCHTRAGGAPFAGGRPLHTPFGVIYSANITPDDESGLGRWSEQDFARALREGVAPDGTHLYPAFPYTAYTKLNDADVHALYLYLRSLAAVRYRPPPNALRFPFGVRALLAGWKLVFLQDARFEPDRTRSAQWNRGAYLTQGLGHCGACHTPRNALGAERAALALSGGSYLDEIYDEVIEDQITPLDDVPVRAWSTANLTPARDGLAAWSIEDLVAYLETGHNSRAGAFGPMSEVVRNSTRYLTDADARAMAVYLKGLAPLPRAQALPPPAAMLRSGEVVYTTRCGDCHLASGLGVPAGGTTPHAKTAPPLAGNAALQAADPATLINVVLYGAHERTVDEHSWPKMSGFELSVGLDDEQIAALCSYVRWSWGNHAAACDPASVARQH
jgi:mono/diheme cytochrome c family protein